MISAYYISPEGRQALAARSAEIRADLARRRQQRDHFRKTFDFIAYGQQMGTPFCVGGVPL